MNLTRPEPFVGFEGTEAVSARVPSELHFTSGTARIMSPKTGGFTLLEVISRMQIARSQMETDLRNGITESLEQALPAQHALSVIQRDLANLAVPGGTLSSVFQTASITNVVGGQSSPDFYTTTGLIDQTSPWAEIQRVSYVLMDPTDRGAVGKDLVRTVARNLLPPTADEQPAQQWLMGGVQGVTFYYYDGTQWRDSWDSTTADRTTGLTNNLPQAIKVQIQLASQQTGRALSVAAPIELVVPIVVQARTNRTQQASGVTR